jgi:vacuolar-type H+-ATPase subunit H
MARKGIEEMIAEIEIFVGSCKYQPLSSTKIIVPKDDLDQMLNELKLKLPNEIERCKKIMRNKEAILADARARADSIITESVAEANRLVDQSQIVEQANERANQILDMARSQADQIIAEANADAQEIRVGSMYYSKDKLSEISQYIEATLQAERTNFDNLIKSLEDNANLVADNIAELDYGIGQLNGTPDQGQAAEEPYDDEPQENYNVYGKTEYDEDQDDDDYDDDYDDEDYDDDDEDDFLDD